MQRIVCGLVLAELLAFTAVAHERPYYHRHLPDGTITAFRPASELPEGSFFTGVDYIETITTASGERDEHQRDALLEIDVDAQELRLVDEKRGASVALYATIQFDEVSAIQYTQSQNFRAADAILISPLALFYKEKKHWLLIEHTDAQVVMRLDKSNQRELREALATAGFMVERIDDE